ncbi:MAG: PilZ domain-containing protein [Candidatus Electronema aureum]|uniref:PilZ domain-containing protein n=1 Tax=Candidatus Electronema aureum TaxID=2005002 RepID=A0A521G3K4_9BACT|nr:PilZ domain-containing protein [Desulfobulbus sp. F5]TAA75553.1 MAG: PilZ domain-containing protein [Candidatus Electronema aureum]
MTEENIGKCRRETPRIERNAALMVTKLQYPMTNLIAKPATTKNLAENGLCFTAEDLYEPGTILQLSVDLRGWQHYLNNIISILDAGTASRPLTAIAEVVWAQHLPEEEMYDIGVRFKDIYEDDLRAFKKYLEKLFKND